MDRFSKRTEVAGLVFQQLLLSLQLLLELGDIHVRVLSARSDGLYGLFLFDLVLFERVVHLVHFFAELEVELLVRFIQFYRRDLELVCFGDYVVQVCRELALVKNREDHVSHLLHRDHPRLRPLLTIHVFCVVAPGVLFVPKVLLLAATEVVRAQQVFRRLLRYL